ncbi:MAG: NADPH:quinone oxidoreductase family protein [Woeseia sp.]
MRALVCKQYGPPEDLVLETIDDPTPGQGQVLVGLKAAGVNFADLLMFAGKYQVRAKPPFVPGAEGAGVVEAIGDGVTRFKVGDRVILTSMGGAFAEKCTVPEQRIFPILPGLDYPQAAGFPIAYGTSYHALRQRAGLRAGETLLVLGAAGGVGISAVEIGKALGARVIAAASNEEKLAFARSAGADETVNYSAVSLKDAVGKLTDGKGVDVVYDPVGGELAQQAFRATAWHGRHLVIGFTSGDIPDFPANIALLKERSIIGVYWGDWAARDPEGQARNIREMSELIAEGSLRPRVTGQYPLEKYIDAFDQVTGRRVMGKVVLTMD